MGAVDENVPPQDPTMKARTTPRERRPSGHVLLFSTIAALLLLALFVRAASQSLTVAGCSGTTCSVPGLNSDDNLNDGATIPKGSTTTTTWTTTSFNASSTIGDVFLIVTHGGDTGLNGNLNIVLENTAGTTTYCAFSPANSVASTKETINTTSSCAWTKARLDDLAITFTNGVTGKPYNAYLSYVSVNISYLPPDTTPPNVSAGTPANSSWSLTGNQTFTYTASDDRGLSNCSLFLDGTLTQTNSSPVNASAGSFTVTGIADGNHTWKVNCTDTSNNTGASELRTLKVDTTPPTVSLMTPANNTPFTGSGITFVYNASDAQTTLASCILIINGVVKDTKTNPAANTPLNSTQSLSNGQYNWSVNCTDANGFTGSSVTRNLTVTIILPFVVTGFSGYALGQTVNLTGSNWNPSVELTINYTLSNGTVVTHLVNSTSGGTMNDTLLLGYGYPTGNYSVYAYETLDGSKNSSANFAVTLPTTTVPLLSV